MFGKNKKQKTKTKTKILKVNVLIFLGQGVKVLTKKATTICKCKTQL